MAIGLLLARMLYAVSIEASHLGMTAAADALIAAMWFGTILLAASNLLLRQHLFLYLLGTLLAAIPGGLALNYAVRKLEPGTGLALWAIVLVVALLPLGRRFSGPGNCGDPSAPP